MLCSSHVRFGGGSLGKQPFKISCETKNACFRAYAAWHASLYSCFFWRGNTRMISKNPNHHWKRTRIALFDLQLPVWNPRIFDYLPKNPKYFQCMLDEDMIRRVLWLNFDTCFSFLASLYSLDGPMNWKGTRMVFSIYIDTQLIT